MSANLKLFFFLKMTIVFAELPPIEKCKLSDSACLLTTAQVAVPVFTSGMPEIGAESLDPMQIDHIIIDLAGLKADISNSTVKGMKESNITMINVDTTKMQLLVSWECDVIMKGNYKASGHLLIIPVSGDGDITLQLYKLHIDMTTNYNISKNDDGKDFMDLMNYKFTFDVKRIPRIDITNLFNGNKGLSDTLFTFVSQNWKLLSREFGRPMLIKPIKKVYETLKLYLKSQPLDDLDQN
ncbi:circadian clock-controlled protein daywake-like [Pectinophora gossypiella]|uniref:circadian clock-controlled protein daywake-like n=1 Tax=Pectinophora gossypiella TaxID=13191 RepID=UPI00214F378E|nr:circadian clock-controlled protein daywake-like [Pectinophora gossypiella]